MKTIADIEKRSVEHTAAIRGLALSKDGRECADRMIEGVCVLIAGSKGVEHIFGEEQALDFFYDRLVEVYRACGWTRLGWRDMIAISKTASWRDVASWRALKASAQIATL